MKNKRIGVLIISIVIILVVVGVYFLTQNKKSTSSSSFPHNTKMEADFNKVINDEIQKQKQNGVVLSIKESEILDLPGIRAQGYVLLNCEGNVDFNVQDEVAQSIGQQILKLQTDQYPQLNEFWVDIKLF